MFRPVTFQSNQVVSVNFLIGLLIIKMIIILGGLFFDNFGSRGTLMVVFLEKLLNFKLQNIFIPNAHVNICFQTFSNFNQTAQVKFL